MEEKYKPSAKCKYHSLCSLYNNDVLSLDIEKKMCGRGQKINKKYEPNVPEPDDFVPSVNYAHGSGGTCEAYMRFEDCSLISKIVGHLYSIKKEIEKHGYW